MRALINSAVVVVVALTAVVTGGSASAGGGPVRGAGYVWADNPTAASYTPDPTYQMNSTGLTATNTITRSGLGVYAVRFPGLGVVGGVAHATAYGPGTHRCKVGNWFVSGDDQVVTVRCSTHAGAPVDSRFTANFTNVTQWRGLEYGQTYPGAYLFAGNPTSPSYTPTPTYQYNSVGESNTVLRTGVGTYKVLVPGIGHLVRGGHAQVTAYGSGSERCAVFSFGWTTPASVISISVRCHAAAGTPVDSRFALTFTDRTNTLGLSGCCNTDGHQSGYALAHRPTEASYPPAASYLHEVPAGGATATRLGTGTYSLRFTHADLATGNVHAAASGGWDGQFCKVGHWSGETGINVRCFNAAGAPADMPYDLNHTGPWLLG
ncbi:hypothetical protein ACFFSW_08075 [Saccharothrix longispora]|uniref:Uncharacterized protein n=1 Tax=Saccharothrix longispora TaxID=33920 RepID=A0ABU1Q6R3_9PSEU|nr:hypothetical protein [Saccharothrix longispora]MDR6598597.1 hypothetical protein [Saccharothrix longispora]